MSNTQDWHLRARNPSNPVVFFGTELCTISDVLLLDENADVGRFAADVTIGGTPAGRVQIELFADIVPKTAENVRQFFTGEYRCSMSGTFDHTLGTAFA